jgi:hypothetical protein
MDKSCILGAVRAFAVTNTSIVVHAGSITFGYEAIVNFDVADTGTEPTVQSGLDGGYRPVSLLTEIRPITNGTLIPRFLE